MAQLLGPAYTASESVTVTSAAKALTAGTYVNAKHAHITCESNPVRYWLDGSNPSATVGHRLEAGGILDLDNSHQIANVKFYAVGANATLRVSYGAG